MLDDLRKIHERDAHDALGCASHMWRQLTYECEITPLLPTHHISNIVYLGMGGSAVAALLVPVWPALTVPFEVVHSYTIPSYVGPDTLCIASSYSGDTEEVIVALEQAKSAGARIAVITSGGTLAEIARTSDYSLIRLPVMQQSRFAVLYTFKALVTILRQAGVAAFADDELKTAADFVMDACSGWGPTVATKDNLAKQIAQECMGKSVVIYAGATMAPAAHAWKICINESAKQVAWYGVLPEFSHNEFIGWSGQPEHKPYAVIELRSGLEHDRVQRRFEATERLLSGRWPAPIVVPVQGETVVQQVLWAMLLGNFVSIYLAVLNGIDPSPLKLVDTLKRALQTAPKTS